MVSKLKNAINKLLVSIQKNLTLGLFFVLPTRVSRIFVSLSILAMIYDIREYTYNDHPVDQKKFNELMRMSFNEDIMALPSYTMHWFWRPDFLDTSVTFDGVGMTLKQAILNRDVFLKNRCAIINQFLVEAPKLIQTKLKLDRIKNRRVIENNVVTLLGHAA